MAPLTRSIKLAEKLSMFSDYWHPRVIANYNGNEVRVAKVKGEFTWHAHADTDELFFVLEGELEIQFRDRIVPLKQGEMLVVPKGVEHRPVAQREAHILLIDREGESTTGQETSPLTRTDLDRI